MRRIGLPISARQVVGNAIHRIELYSWLCCIDFHNATCFRSVHPCHEGKSYGCFVRFMEDEVVVVSANGLWKFMNTRTDCSRLSKVERSILNTPNFSCWDQCVVGGCVEIGIEHKL